MDISKHLHAWSEPGASGGLWEMVGDVVEVFGRMRERVGEQGAEERGREKGVLQPYV